MSKIFCIVLLFFLHMQIVSIFANPPFCIAFLFFSKIHRLKNTHCTIIIFLQNKLPCNSSISKCLYMTSLQSNHKTKIFWNIYLPISLSVTTAHTPVHIHKCTYTQTHKKLYKNIASEALWRPFNQSITVTEDMSPFFSFFPPISKWNKYLYTTPNGVERVLNMFWRHTA